MENFDPTRQQRQQRDIRNDTGGPSSSNNKSPLEQHRAEDARHQAAYHEAARIDAARIDAARIAKTKEDILKEYINPESIKEALAKIKSINDAADSTKVKIINDYLSEDRKATIRQYKTETEHKFLKEIGLNTAEDRTPDEIPSKDITGLIIRGTSSVDFIAGTKTKEALMKYGVPDNKISQVFESLKYTPDEPPAKRRRIEEVSSQDKGKQPEYLSQPQDRRDEVGPSPDARDPAAYQQMRQRLDTLLFKGLDHLNQAITKIDKLHTRYNDDHVSYNNNYNKNLGERYKHMSELAGKYAQGTKQVLDNLKDIKENLDKNDAQGTVDAYTALEKAIDNPVIQSIIAPWWKNFLSTDNPPSASDKGKAIASSLTGDQPQAPRSEASPSRDINETDKKKSLIESLSKDTVMNLKRHAQSKVFELNRKNEEIETAESYNEILDICNRILIINNLADAASRCKMVDKSKKREEISQMPVSDLADKFISSINAVYDKESRLHLREAMKEVKELQKEKGLEDPEGEGKQTEHLSHRAEASSSQNAGDTTERNSLRRLLRDPGTLGTTKRDIGLLSLMKADNDTMNTRKELKKHIDALYNFVNNDDGDYSAIKSTIEILSAKHNDYTEKDVIGNTTSISRFLSYITKDLQIPHSAV